MTSLQLPKRQYLGIFKPTTPVTHAPECIPILNLNGIPGKCLILNSPQKCNKLSANVAISPACLLPFLTGKPEATLTY
jgi:hypothetical protein